jgi:hypothetical protein
MWKLLVAVLVLLPLAAGCAQHSQSYDDAYAQCQGDATKQMETAGVAADQRATWQQGYISHCMQAKGFKV